MKYRRDHASDGQESLEGFLEVISGVPFVDAEMVLNAEGYTIELPVIVKVQADLDTLIEIDKRTLQKIGQMALNSLGYDEIMKRAEDLGWVKWEPIEPEQAQSTVDKNFIGDVSLSPTPQPPLRPPPPPPTGVIAKTATKRVVTRAAPRVVAKVLPAAAAAAAADGPLPIGEIIAVGSVVVALIVEYGLKPEEVLVLGGGQAHHLTAAASAAAANSSPATTPTAQPAPKPRKYPNQTCEDDERERLDDEMHEICNNKKRGFAVDCPKDPLRKKEFAKIPCSLIKHSLQQRQACLAARWKVQNECFGGKPDKEHKDEIDAVQNGINNCEAFKLINCAKDHPMAGK